MGRRSTVRSLLLQLILKETPFIALIQRFRTPILDFFMSWIGALGTHTFFMLGLPMLFWFEFGYGIGGRVALSGGYEADLLRVYGMDMVLLLAEGVYISNVIKVC